MVFLLPLRLRGLDWFVLSAGLGSLACGGQAEETSSPSSPGVKEGDKSEEEEEQLGEDGHCLPEGTWEDDIVWEDMPHLKACNDVNDCARATRQGGWCESRPIAVNKECKEEVEAALGPHACPLEPVPGLACLEERCVIEEACELLGAAGCGDVERCELVEAVNCDTGESLEVCRDRDQGCLEGTAGMARFEGSGVEWNTCYRFPGGCRPWSFDQDEAACAACE